MICFETKIIEEMGGGRTNVTGVPGFIKDCVGGAFGDATVEVYVSDVSISCGVAKENATEVMAI